MEKGDNEHRERGERSVDIGSSRGRNDTQPVGPFLETHVLAYLGNQGCVHICVGFLVKFAEERRGILWLSGRR